MRQALVTLVFLLVGCHTCARQGPTTEEAPDGHSNSEAHMSATPSSSPVVIVGPDLPLGLQVVERFGMRVGGSEKGTVAGRAVRVEAIEERRFVRKTVVLDVGDRVDRARISYLQYERERRGVRYADGRQADVPLPDSVPQPQPFVGHEYVVQWNGKEGVVTEFDARRPTGDEQDVFERYTSVARSLVVNHQSGEVVAGLVSDVAVEDKVRTYLAWEAGIVGFIVTVEVHVAPSVPRVMGGDSVVVCPFVVEAHYNDLRGLIETETGTPAVLFGSGEVVFGRHGLPLTFTAKIRLEREYESDGGVALLSEAEIQSAWEYALPPGKSWRYQSVDEEGK